MSQKLENQLNLALETPEEVRVATQDLNVGFDPLEETWELVVKYNGSTEELNIPGVIAEPLIAGYAILTVPESRVEEIAALPQIEYVEKPKRFYYGQMGPVERACIGGITFREPFLTGRGILVAVLDSGIAYERPEFRWPDGRTRIRYLWDQTLRRDEELPGPPAGFQEGVEFDRERINRALEAGSLQERYRLVPSRDSSGHGTAVAGIAAASFVGNYQGVAPDAELLIVKLGSGTGESGGFSKTTEIMRGITYVIKKARELGMPMVINLSFGNTYGPHDGSSLLDRFLDNAAEIGRTVVCVGNGNEGSSGGHAAGEARTITRVELAVAPLEKNLNVQLWTYFTDRFQVSLRSPGGETIILRTPDSEMGGYQVLLSNTRILVYLGEPTPYSTARELYLELLPENNNGYITAGVWTFVLDPVEIVTGQYYFYLPSAVTRNVGTAFLRPSVPVTMTIPSTASKVISVGAYDPATSSYADFSGRGYERATRSGAVTAGLVKPDFVAQGVNLLAPDVYGGFIGVTGTSFATPVVTGSSALLMEWGMIRGNDPYLYGEKMKAYLRAGAKPLRGESIYPNEKVGYGVVCPAASLQLAEGL